MAEEDTLDTFVAPRYRKQRATPSSKETKAAAAEAAQFAAEMLIPQSAFDAGLMLIPGGKIARKAGAALIALDAGDAQAGALTKMLKAIKGSNEVADAVKEQKMLQGFYRGYAGDYDAAKAGTDAGMVFVSPQRAVGEIFANKRAAQTNTDPHLEMILADPFAGYGYGMNVPLNKQNQKVDFTRARQLDPKDVKERTQLYAEGGSVSAYDPNQIDAIINGIDAPTGFAEGGEVNTPDFDFKEDPEALRLYKYAMKQAMPNREDTMSSTGTGVKARVAGGDFSAGIDMNRMTQGQQDQLMKSLAANYNINLGDVNLNARMEKPLDAKDVYVGMLNGSIPFGEGRAMLGLQGIKTPAGTDVIGYNAGYSGKIGPGRLSANVNMPKRGRKSANIQYQIPFAEGGQVHMGKGGALSKLVKRVSGEDAAAKAIGTAAESAGMKAPVTANKPLTDLQDFSTSLSDRIRQGAAETQIMIDSMPFKFDRGQRVFTEDSAKKNRAPYEILERTRYGNQVMRADHPTLGANMGQTIRDPETGKAMRTPYEPGYRVRGEIGEMILPESAIKGNVDFARGGSVSVYDPNQIDAIVNQYV